MKINPSKNSDFSFVIDANNLTKQLARVLSVSSFSPSGESERHHILIAHRGEVYIVGYSPETFVCVKTTLEEKCEGEGFFEFDAVALQGLIKRRSHLRMAFESNQLKINAVKGKYACLLKTVEVSPEYIARINKGLSQKAESTELSASDMQELKGALDHTALKSIYSIDKDNGLLSYITVSGGRLTVSAMDDLHMALYRAKISSSAKFQLALSSSAFNLIFKFIDGEEDNAKFALGSKGMSVFGESFTLSLPPIQTEDIKFSLVQQFLKTVSSKRKCGFKLPNSAFDTIDNMNALAKNKEKFKFALNPKGIVKVTIDTDNGSVSDMFKVADCDASNGHKWSVDPVMFYDLYKKLKAIGSEIPIELYQPNVKEGAAFLITKVKLSGTSNVILVGTHE